MSEPTSAYSFQDLVAKIAHEMGVAYYGGGEGRALIPADDEYNLQLCKEIVNDGVKMFISDPPKVFRRTTLHQAIYYNPPTAPGTLSLSRRRGLRRRR